MPLRYFRQLLKDLGDPQVNAIRITNHWRPPILKALTKKITYRLFDLTILKDALERQTILSLKEQVHWCREDELTNGQGINEDPREAIAAAKRKARGQVIQNTITSTSNFVVGYGEGRATRELDVIWWPNLYNNIAFGKLVFRIYVNKVQLFKL